ncbi:helix-turn-helix transcriptional regulator [Paenibacillus larvae]
MEYLDFGKYLKRQREEKGLTINQLASISGISNAQISRIETGLRNTPKPETIKKLSDALETNYEEMMEAAGYLLSEKHEIPSWATKKDILDFKKALEKDAEIMFDGVPIDDEDKEKIKLVMEAIFWDAKKKQKNEQKKK